MGFFDDRAPATPGGLNFVSKSEKEVLKDEKVALTVTSVGIGAGFEGRGKAYYLVVELDGEERAIGGFTIGSGVESRDALLADMAEYCETEEGQSDPPVVRLEKAGRAWIIVPAEVNA